jgi:hypothetical protein
MEPELREFVDQVLIIRLMSQTPADFHGLVARLRPGEKLGDRIIKVSRAGEL